MHTRAITRAHAPIATAGATGRRRICASSPHHIFAQATWPAQFEATSAHKFRASDDMQFSFSYFYFLINQRKTYSPLSFFGELDADGDGITLIRRR